ncbi:MAG TPA: APC family permease [Sphingobium sp.]|uniref:APC family permease n=1 Tax=Sphingobium sp. TaxID=1912891 RepID=UPI002ED5B4A1
MHEREEQTETIAPHLGPLDIAFFVIAAAAPLGATVGIAPLVYSQAGFGVTYLFGFAAVALLLFSCGFAYSFRISGGTGGFAELIAMGLGSAMGDMAAGISLLAYCAMLAGIVGQLASYIAVPLGHINGREWVVLAAAILLLVAVLGYRRIDLSRRIMAACIILELAALLSLDLALLFSSPGNGVGAPAPVFPSIGAPGTAVGLMFAFACFVGFESTALYGEEARDAGRTLPIATFLSIGTIGVFYGFTMWCLGVAYREPSLHALASSAPEQFVLATVEHYMGTTAKTIIEVLAGFSIVAVLISFHNALARYLHQLAGSGLLDRRLHKVHPAHGSPYVASVTVSVAVAIIVACFAAAGADPVGQLYMWLVALGTLAIVLIQALCAISVTLFLIRKPAPGTGGIALATGVGGAGLVIAFILCLTHFKALSGSGTVTTWLPALIPAAALLLLALRSKRNAI